MNQVREILARCDRYVKKSGLAPSTVSRLVFKDGKRLDAIKDGSRVWPETLERAADKLDELEAKLERKRERVS